MDLFVDCQVCQMHLPKAWVQHDTYRTTREDPIKTAWAEAMQLTDGARRWQWIYAIWRPQEASVADGPWKEFTQKKSGECEMSIVGGFE